MKKILLSGFVLAVVGCVGYVLNFLYGATPQIPGQQWRVHDTSRPLPEVVSPGENFQSPRIIDLKTGFPVRFLMQPLNDCTHLGFRTHHAAMDGGGGLQFVSDWLLTYHRISIGRDKPRSRTTDIGGLRHRNHLRLLNRRFLGTLWIQPIAVFGASKFLFRRVQPVLRRYQDSDRRSAVEEMAPQVLMRIRGCALRPGP